MSQHLPANLRQTVAKRAGFRCEYCRRPEEDSFIRYQIDHIISIKHGRTSQSENLAFSCPICNSFKGSDLGTVLNDQTRIIPLFHPRKQYWFDHFAVNKGEIIPKTETGAATIKLLNFNHPTRILERIDLIKAGLFP